MQKAELNVPIRERTEESKAEERKRAAVMLAELIEAFAGNDFVFNDKMITDLLCWSNAVLGHAPEEEEWLDNLYLTYGRFKGLGFL